jgi:tripartite-type tricarboxylate transporter receptor subunit TctC
MGPVKDGKVKALAVSTPKRIAALPNVPTIAEAGFPKAESNFWVALLAPAKTPRDIVTKLNAEVNKALQSPEVKDRLAKLGTESTAMTPEQFDRFVAEEYRALGDVMVKAGATPQ